MHDKAITKPEIIRIVVQLSLLSLGTFFSVRWLISQLDPTSRQKKIAKKKAKEQLNKLRIPDANLNDYEMTIASHLVNPEDIMVDWSQIAGLDDVIQEIKETVILPVVRSDLFYGSKLTQPPKGILLFGPPGCGKTLIAKATAKEADMRFINLDVSILTDKWYGESQKLAAAVFSLAVKLQPCIVFIDEIDSFLRRRNSQDHEATAMMKAQFMSLWDGLITDPDCTVIVMGATNRPTDLDKAILRRLPSSFYIRLPGVEQRRQILKLILDGEPLENVDIDRLASKTDGFSGSDLKELCRKASIYRVRDYFRNRSSTSGTSDQGEERSPRRITMQDLELSLDKMKETRMHSETLPLE
ncbi:outer mitochondrial transmembrane helix translocase-like [Planococcus citri]|uniref:outer mitochondrial transmembrane helix translocase-like n=1 Tax=Planococcus citri TaxID=170843 RepID=UPI0031F79075